MRSFTRLLVPLFLMVLTMPLDRPADAQVSSTTGAIIGTVTDNSKAVMPGVTITVSGPALMGTRTVTTDPDGTYRIPSLPPGENYKLTFELAGFGTVTREGIALGAGFTASINIEMGVSTLTESVTVSGASPVVDTTATKVTTQMNAVQMSNVLGSRDYTMLMSSVPGVTLATMDVGGSNSINNVAYTAYGLTGQNRGEVEGMYTSMPGGASSDMNYSNFNSFEDFAVNAIGNDASMPKPGNLSSVVSKSGGNVYHGMVYQDYENDKMESRNIDDAQIALGVRGGGKVATRDINRLVAFHDFHADLGGFIKKDKLWWYGAYRYQVQFQNFPAIIDGTAHIRLPIRSFKVTYNLTPNNKFTGYFTRGTKHHDNYTGAIPTTTSNVASTGNQVYPTGTVTAAYETVLGTKAVMVFRVGKWYDGQHYIGKCDQVPNGEGGVGFGAPCAIRYQDTGANMVNGTFQTTIGEALRPQANGSLTYFQDGWWGSHNFKVGSEFYRDTQRRILYQFGDMVLILNNGRPSQVQLWQPPIESANMEWTVSGYVQDSWRVNSRLTLNLGMRLDHYRSYTPAQAGPYGLQFDEITGATWNSPGSRLGVVYAVTDDQKTVIKANYGQYWQNPGPELSGVFNAASPQNYSTYEWIDPNPVYVPAPAPTADPRGHPVFNPATIGRLISVSGTNPNGTPAVTTDPNLKNTYNHQALLYVEREVAANFGVRTGMVWNGYRQGYSTVNVNAPLSAYNVPVTVTSAGADNIPNTGDDVSLTAFNLDAEHLALPAKQVIQNSPLNDSDYYTWEITANRRPRGRWSMLATFAETWSQQGPIPLANTNTLLNSPNTLINTTDGKNNFSFWSAKLSGTLDVNWGIRLLPQLRHQSGTAFAPTFTTRLNYGSVPIKASDNSSARTPNMTIVDLRAEKYFTMNAKLLGQSRLGLFLDVYNLLNANKAQTLTQSFGAAYLRPITIMGPRILRVGAKLTF